MEIAWLLFEGLIVIAFWVLLPAFVFAFGCRLLKNCINDQKESKLNRLPILALSVFLIALPLVFLWLLVRNS